MRFRIVTTIAVCLALAGCTGSPMLDPDASGSPSASPRPSASPSPTASPAPSASPSTTPSPSPTPSATPAPRPSPTPAPTAPPAEAADACAALLDAETAARFADSAASGWGPIDDFGDRMVAEGNVSGLFVEYGGVACQWGYPSSGDAFSYGQSAISAANAASVKSRLLSEGYVQSAGLGGELYCLPVELSPTGDESCFLFVGGEWFYTSIASELEMIVSQSRGD